MNNISFKKKFILDFILSFLSTVIPIAILQLVVYPVTSRILNSDGYGLMLTFYSLFMLISNSGGAVLSNLRLLYDKRYKEECIEGDFNVLLRDYLIINVVVIGVLAVIYWKNIGIFNLTTTLVTSILILLTAYLSVELRIHLDYKKIVINSLLLGIGYLVSLGLFFLTKQWDVIYLLPNSISFIYLLKNTTYMRESFKKSYNFKVLFHKGNLLIVSVILASSMSYVDKMILYPLLGGHFVSIYYTASLLGKIISMIITPMSNVILSYIAHIDSMSRKQFNKVLIYGCVLCLIGYIVCICITRPVLGILFPQWLNEVLKYIPWTTLIAVLGALGGLLHPFVLKYADLKWQNIIYGGSLAIYLMVSILLVKPFGLMGFCMGGIIAAVVKIVIMIVIYYKTNN